MKKYEVNIYTKTLEIYTYNINANNSQMAQHKAIMKFRYYDDDSMITNIIIKER